MANGIQLNLEGHAAGGSKEGESQAAKSENKTNKQQRNQKHYTPSLSLIIQIFMKVFYRKLPPKEIQIIKIKPKKQQEENKKKAKPTKTNTKNQTLYSGEMRFEHVMHHSFEGQFDLTREMSDDGHAGCMTQLTFGSN